MVSWPRGKFNLVESLLRDAPQVDPKTRLSKPLEERVLTVPVESVPVTNKAIRFDIALHERGDSSYVALITYGTNATLVELDKDNPHGQYNKLVTGLSKGAYKLSVHDGTLSLNITNE
ncbi:MAG: hypothetical protein AABX53_03970 [Nanoarchaeota archaeon]